MDIIECIQRRYSYRGPYKSTPVPSEDLGKYLRPALRPLQVVINRQHPLLVWMTVKFSLL